jgi:hypothetical protein
MAMDGHRAAVHCRFKGEQRPGSGRLRVTTRLNPLNWSAPRHAAQRVGPCLKVTADGVGLIGHASAVLLRKAADQAGLTGQLGGALRKKGTSPDFDRGAVLVSLAAAIALGAASMSDIALLALGPQL